MVEVSLLVGVCPAQKASQAAGGRGSSTTQTWCHSRATRLSPGARGLHCPEFGQTLGFRASLGWGKLETQVLRLDPSHAPSATLGKLLTLSLSSKIALTLLSYFAVTF